VQTYFFDKLCFHSFVFFKAVLAGWFVVVMFLVVVVATACF
jgi:hypothetical protein